MTAAEFSKILCTIDFYNLPDEELAKFHELLSMREEEIRWIMRGRKHLKKHYAPKKKN